MFEGVQDQEGRSRRAANTRHTIGQLLWLPVVFVNVVLVAQYGWVVGIIACVILNVAIGIGVGLLVRWLEQGGEQ